MSGKLDLYNNSEDSPLTKAELKRAVYEQTEVDTDRVPYQNEWEKRRWNSNGYDQSGFKRG